MQVSLDDAGRRAADKLYQAFPEKFCYVPMTECKDANEFLETGKQDKLMWAARSPQRYTPENFFCSDADVEAAIKNENPYEYVPTGHTGLMKRYVVWLRVGLPLSKHLVVLVRQR